MNIIQEAIDTAKHFNGDEIEDLKRELTCFRLLVPFVNEQVTIEFEHSEGVTYQGELFFDSLEEVWAVGEAAFRTHWLDAIDIDTDGSLLLALSIPPEELEELIEMERYKDE